MENTKVKINIKSGEIEFEGSEEFVQSQMDNLDSIIRLLKLNESKTNSSASIENVIVDVYADPDDVQEDGVPSIESVPASFGEWMHMFKESINDVEKALLTAYFVQKQSDKNEFKTLEVSKSLKDHGIKLTNTSQSIKQLDTKKYIFQVRKEGDKLNFMRVSLDGVNHLKTLFR